MSVRWIQVPKGCLHGLLRSTLVSHPNLWKSEVKAQDGKVYLSVPIRTVANTLLTKQQVRRVFAIVGKVLEQVRELGHWDISAESIGLESLDPLSVKLCWSNAPKANLASLLTAALKRASDGDADVDSESDEDGEFDVDGESDMYKVEEPLMKSVSLNPLVVGRHMVEMKHPLSEFVLRICDEHEEPHFNLFEMKKRFSALHPAYQERIAQIRWPACKALVGFFREAKSPTTSRISHRDFGEVLPIISAIIDHFAGKHDLTHRIAESESLAHKFGPHYRPRFEREQKLLKQMLEFRQEHERRAEFGKYDVDEMAYFKEEPLDAKTEQRVKVAISASLIANKAALRDLLVEDLRKHIDSQLQGASPTLVKRVFCHLRSSMFVGLHSGIAQGCNETLASMKSMLSNMSGEAPKKRKRSSLEESDESDADESDANESDADKSEESDFD